MELVSLNNCMTWQEYDHPWNLLQNGNGIFSSLVNTTGKVNSGLLRTAAELV